MKSGIIIIVLANADEDGNDDGAPDENSVTVIDIVDSFRLKEINLDKKAWTAYIKGIYKSISNHDYRIRKEGQGKA